MDAARDAASRSRCTNGPAPKSQPARQPVYAYMFSRVHPYVAGVKFSDHDPNTVGVYHTADVPYLARNARQPEHVPQDARLGPR